MIESFSPLNKSQALGGQVTLLTRNAQAFRDAAPHLAQDAGVCVTEGSLAILGRREVATAPSYDFVIHAATETSAALAAGGASAFLESVEGTRQALELAV